LRCIFFFDVIFVGKIVSYQMVSIKYQRSSSAWF
jgi:hypothetical protein